MRWYRESTDPEYAKALKIVGDIYYFGKGVSQNYTEAMKWYRESADKGNDEARLKLDQMYAEGQGVFYNRTEPYPVTQIQNKAAKLNKKNINLIK